MLWQRQIIFLTFHTWIRVAFIDLMLTELPVKSALTVTNDLWVTDFAGVSIITTARRRAWRHNGVRNVTRNARIARCALTRGSAYTCLDYEKLMLLLVMTYNMMPQKHIKGKRNSKVWKKERNTRKIVSVNVEHIQHICIFSKNFNYCLAVYSRGSQRNLPDFMLKLTIYAYSTVLTLCDNTIIYIHFTVPPCYSFCTDTLKPCVQIYARPAIITWRTETGIQAIHTPSPAIYWLKCTIKKLNPKF